MSRIFMGRKKLTTEKKSYMRDLLNWCSDVWESNTFFLPKLLDCGRIGACAVIRSNTVCCGYSFDDEVLLMSTHKAKVLTAFSFKLSHQASGSQHCNRQRIILVKKSTVLTLKMPRKPASENVVCLCHLLNILANFSNLFLHTGKQCEPRSDCS